MSSKPHFSRLLFAPCCWGVSSLGKCSHFRHSRFCCPRTCALVGASGCGKSAAELYLFAWSCFGGFGWHVVFQNSTNCQDHSPSVAAGRLRSDFWQCLHRTLWPSNLDLKKQTCFKLGIWCPWMHGSWNADRRQQSLRVVVEGTPAYGLSSMPGDFGESCDILGDLSLCKEKIWKKIASCDPRLRHKLQHCLETLSQRQSSSGHSLQVPRLGIWKIKNITNDCHTGEVRGEERPGLDREHPGAVPLDLSLAFLEHKWKIDIDSQYLISSSS